MSCVPTSYAVWLINKIRKIYTQTIHPKSFITNTIWYVEGMFHFKIMSKATVL